MVRIPVTTAANANLPREAEDKVAFFNELSGLDNTFGEEASDLTIIFDSVPRRKPTLSAPVETQDTPRTAKWAKAPATHRIVSEPITITSPPSNVIFAETPMNLQRKKSGPQQTESAPTSSSDKAALEETTRTSLGKRKRKQPPLKLVPENRQIFRGLYFFYIPNSDISPVRRARITKAREYGVNWCKEFYPWITHIIVDKGIPYGDVIKNLKVPGIPAGVILVDELYPLDCIQFRAVLNSDQNQYKVKGQLEALEKTPQILSSQASDGSLKVKPMQSKSGRWNYVTSRETTPPSQNSVQGRLSSQEELRSPEKLSLIVWHGDTPETTHPFRERELHDTRDIQPPKGADNIGANPKGDGLDEIIWEARMLQHLPLDEDENGQSMSGGDKQDSEDSDDEACTSRKAHSNGKKAIHKTGFNQGKFSCMIGGTGKTSSSNPNARTISILQKMVDYYTRINDTWRPNAYRKAMATLRQQTTRITTSEEASKLPFIGQSLALKIEEIVRTDRLRRLENAETKSSDIILQKFMGIYGVGSSQASKWLYAGYRTLEDLKAHAQLTNNQLLGIEHYDDFQTRIPRQEVSALGEIVKAAAFKIDSTVEIIICGSYRRGATDSGDIDCIITKPNTESSCDISSFLSELISHLKSSNFLVAALAVPRSESGTKWHGCCILPNNLMSIWRRIDFLLVPATELGAALLYFTGNDIFNRSIRLLASKKGMRLNQRGLYKDVMRGPGRVKITQGQLVEGVDEKKIFEALGVPWRPPEQRIC